ncbi:MAG: transcriptional regulator [Deltaproteobacteria bacterium]|nr:MAG: transcriptional regulator [Deltaproteobacteria bacterium]
MLEQTKKPPINMITLTLKGPEANKGQAVKALKRLGFTVLHADENENTIPWRDAFPEFSHNEVGASLAGARHKKGMTQEKLSESTGIPRRHISEMENNKRPLGKTLAQKIAGVLEVDYRVFL